MPKSLLEFADWLDRKELLWPAAPPPTLPKATPFLLPLPEIRAVTWSVYGTLLLVADGKLLPTVPERMRMEIALEKTIHEFNMWNSMSRKPGAPWEYMLQQLQSLVEARQLSGTGKKGESPEVSLPAVWSTLIERLQQKDYVWDEQALGAIDEFSEKVAYFFQSCLQGMRAAPNALAALQHVRQCHFRQGIIADGQSFTLVQLVRMLRAQGEPPPLTRLFTSGCVSLSYQLGVRQPSSGLFEASLAALDERGIAPHQVVHIASRVRDELAPAKKLGMKTALFAGDRLSLQATGADMQDSQLRPDRILTDLRQLRQIVRPEP
ncbi:MAG: HAD family hydrolase [Planctomycetales bacterium]